jgi:hypothetical protein
MLAINGSLRSLRVSNSLTAAGAIALAAAFKLNTCLQVGGLRLAPGQGRGKRNTADSGCAAGGAGSRRAGGARAHPLPTATPAAQHLSPAAGARPL